MSTMLWSLFVLVALQAFLFTIVITTRPRSEELSWLPQIPFEPMGFIESIYFANNLNPPDALVQGYESPLYPLRFPIMKHPPNYIFFNLYKKLTQPVITPNIDDPVEIQMLLNRLPSPLTFKMDTVSPQKILLPRISNHFLSSISSTSDLEDAARTAGISTSSELFRSFKDSLSNILSSFGTFSTQIVPATESTFSYYHERQCLFLKPSSSGGLFLNSSEIVIHSFLEGDNTVSSISIDPSSFKLVSPSTVHKLSPNLLRGSVSVSYDASSSNAEQTSIPDILLVIHIVTFIDIRHSLKASSQSPTIKSVVKESITGAEKQAYHAIWHVKLEIPFFQDYFLSVFPAIQFNQFRLICVEENEVPPFSLSQQLKPHQLLLSWKNIYSSLHSKEAPNLSDSLDTIIDEVEEDGEEESQNDDSLSLSNMALELFKTFLSPFDNNSPIENTREVSEEENITGNTTGSGGINKIENEVPENYGLTDPMSQNVSNSESVTASFTHETEIVSNEHDTVLNDNSLASVKEKNPMSSEGNKNINIVDGEEEET